MSENKVRKERRIDQIYEALKEEPILSAAEVGERIGCSSACVSSSLNKNYGTNLSELRREVLAKYWQQKPMEGAHDK